MLKKSAMSACFWFTVLSVLYSLLFLLVNGKGYMSALVVLFFFPLSFGICLATNIMKSEKIKIETRVILHFLLFSFSFFVCFMGPNLGAISSSTFIIIAFLYVIVYFVSMLTFLIIRSKNKKKKEKYTEYKKVY